VRDEIQTFRAKHPLFDRVIKGEKSFFDYSMRVREAFASKSVRREIRRSDADIPYADDLLWGATKAINELGYSTLDWFETAYLTASGRKKHSNVNRMYFGVLDSLFIALDAFVAPSLYLSLQNGHAASYSLSIAAGVGTAILSVPTIIIPSLLRSGVDRATREAVDTFTTVATDTDNAIKRHILPRLVE